MPRDRDDEDQKLAVIKEFLIKYPHFASKFKYDNLAWPCFEDKKLMNASFRFRTDAYRIRL